MAFLIRIAKKGKLMKIEHLGLQVAEPAAIADWYVDNFGFSIKRAADAPVPVRFLADCDGNVMLEVYYNPKYPVPDYSSMEPARFHLAFVCDDLDAAKQRLVAAGATIVKELETNDLGDRLAMLRDPWGMAIQLAHRGTPMV